MSGGCETAGIEYSMLGSPLKIQAVVRRKGKRKFIMASEKVSQVMEVLNGMTLLEFNELKETFKESFGVTAAIAAPMGGGGGGERG